MGKFLDLEGLKRFYTKTKVGKINGVSRNQEGDYALVPGDIGALGVNDTAKNSEKLGNATVSDLSAFIINNAFPPGTVLITTLSHEDWDPARHIGGKWTPIEDAFLLGASDSHPLWSSGGAWQHTLTIQEVAPHEHYVFHGSFDPNGSVWGITDGGLGTIAYPAGVVTSNAVVRVDASAYNDIYAQAQPFGITPPYYAFNIWYRVE